MSNIVQESIIAYANNFTKYKVYLSIDNRSIGKTIIYIDLFNGITPDFICWKNTFYNDFFTNEELYFLCLDYIHCMRGFPAFSYILNHDHPNSVDLDKYIDHIKESINYDRIDSNYQHINCNDDDSDHNYCHIIKDYKLGTKEVPSSGIKILREKSLDPNHEYKCIKIDNDYFYQMVPCNSNHCYFCCKK